MMTSVPYYHLCSLLAHLFGKESEFENDFVISYHFFMHFSKFMSETLYVVGRLKLLVKYQ